MSTPAKTIEIKIERTIPASPDELFDAWLNPEIPGTLWNAAEKYLLDPKVDGLFYWTLRGTSHYGRFTDIGRPGLIRHTWVSPNTLGWESIVTLTFAPRGEETLMTLVHSGLPDTEAGRGHEKGWNYFTGIFSEQFGNGSRRDYRREDAHPPKK
ncbi:MAG TPA: SRPBCC domain-containing protein [Bacteroidota bacterium]|nr:SRPBCC domain-containing protein [Bacteroidota bacterium]